ncbi:hypothetical protein PtA15_7A96 [Puccinia triticina]|uniref:Uncharacterized protein n=1 Tax=Puccinia triticina TaxID=208348 RepID=A0ABY7CNU7_9BASI|nr:uncharacterized protein PtA15_7A96 [Puccinia triticina]WAQ86370.1 hypothetical protein PtA15_7A96 [Puccinia triticina]
METQGEAQHKTIEPQTRDDAMDVSDLSDVDQGSEDSSDVDANVLESNLDSKKKAQKAERRNKKEAAQILGIAKSHPLPHPAGALSTSVTGFIKFMMGLSNPQSPLPAPPSDAEILAWTNYVSQRQEIVVQNLQPTAQSNQATDKSSANAKFQRNEKLNRIRSQGLALTTYTAAPEVLPDARCPPISSQTKILCDNTFQRKGFSRITFQWNARSLTASKWNTATALILIERWSNWYKTITENPNDLKEDIQGIIE